MSAARRVTAKAAPSPRPRPCRHRRRSAGIAATWVLTCSASPAPASSEPLRPREARRRRGQRAEAAAAPAWTFSASPAFASGATLARREISRHLERGAEAPAMRPRTGRTRAPNAWVVVAPALTCSGSPARAILQRLARRPTAGRRPSQGRIRPPTPEATLLLSPGARTAATLALTSSASLARARTAPDPPRRRRVEGGLSRGAEVVAILAWTSSASHVLAGVARLRLRVTRRQ
mmetsp:Transcript_14326/g.39558  ORF Transcript_14326/g.39558 Transcript_14326/m.39558 type:complete len:234 (-) Transcript_14326:573-1274(-)